MSHQARWLRRPTFADIFQVKQAASLQIFEGKIILTSLFELFMDIKINSLLVFQCLKIKLVAALPSSCSV